jgi:phage minor structural protein
LILNEYYKSFREENDFTQAILNNVTMNVNVEKNDINPVDFILSENVTLGDMSFTIEADISNHNDSRVFWNEYVPANTSLVVRVSKDEIEWFTVENNTKLPFDSTTIFVQVIFNGTVDFTPILYDFNISMWEEIIVPAIELVTIPKNITLDLIKLYDLKGELNAFLENAQNPLTEELLSAQETLTFSMPFTDAKAKLIKYDCEVTFKGKRYVVTDIQDGIAEDGSFIFDVSCELVYVDLLNKTINEELFLDRLTIAEGMEILLAETEWSIGQIDESGFIKFSMKEIKKTKLWFINQWAKITQREVQWDSINRTVSLVEKKENVITTSFRYRKNLKSIKRKVTPPVATVIYGYGKNGVDFSGINGGKAYIEDYSWYVEQGVPVEMAREKYKKEYIWQDERYLYMYDLKIATEEIAKMLSRPTISYECKVIDLSVLTGKKEDSFAIGEEVLVENEDLAISAITRVVRIKRYHNEPWKNEVELGFLQKGLENESTEISISDDVQSSSASSIFGSNELASVAIDSVPSIALSLNFSNFSTSYAQIGFSVIGQATKDGMLSIKFSIGGKHIWNEIKQRVFAGFNSIGMPFLLQELPSGSDIFKVEMSMDNGIFNIQQNGIQIFIHAQNLLGGGGGSSAPSASVIQYIGHSEYEYDQLLDYNFYESLKYAKQIPIKRFEGDTITKEMSGLVNDGIITGEVSITLTQK